MKIDSQHGCKPQIQSPCLRALALSCELNTAATVISPDSGIVSHGFFQSMENGTVSIRLRPECSPLLSDVFCCVSFEQANRRSYFFTSILGVEEKLDRELVLAIPEEIAVEKRRRAIRLAVPKESGFSVSLHHDGIDVPGEIVNINVTGALVEFGEALNIRLETPLQLELSLRQHRVLVPACPVRRETSRLGFAFEGNNDTDWQAGLRQMLKQVDRDWIGKHSRIANIRRPYVDLSDREPMIRSAERSRLDSRIASQGNVESQPGQ